MAKHGSTVQEKSGIPLGGLGTGTIEIRPDGYFDEWQIFNLGLWASDPFIECCYKESPDIGPEGLTFYIRTNEQGAAPVMRRLGVQSEVHNLTSLPWLKSVREIEFQGEFPFADLNYVDETLPVSVHATMFSPFIPHDARNSGTPGFNTVFKVKNHSDRPVEVSLLGILKNPLFYGSEDRKLLNILSKDKGTACITLSESENKCCCQTTGCCQTAGNSQTAGNMAFSVTGGEISWVLGEYSRYLSGYYSERSASGSFHESVFHNFRRDGMLPSMDGNQSPSQSLKISDDELKNMPLAEKKELLEEFMNYPFANDFIERYKEVNPDILEKEEGIGLLLQEIKFRLDVLAGKDRKKQEWGDCALASNVELQPGEEKEVFFTLSWYFPNHVSPNGGELIGHMYENWFKDAGQVNQFLVENYREHYDKTLKFKNTLFNSDLEAEMVEAWAAQLTTLTKSTWWTKKDEFAVWEGLGCCGFHTTDITYQGSFGLVALFPELQKKQMEMGAKFQREDGFVHHLFQPDLSHVDNEFHRVDMNQQFVMLVCRDYIFTGDREYLTRLWPNVIKALDGIEKMDTDGDGLPDRDTGRNTYDQWNLYGTPSYISSLWLSALLAGIRMAEDLGETDCAKKWRALLKKGTASFEASLWNGEYYSLWVDGEDRDECCMTDQIDGEWFTRLIGLGGCLGDDRVKSVLSTIMKYNFSDEDGLMNATYPPDRKKRFPAYRNFQAQAPWTGIEYLMASMFMENGLTEEALSVVKNVHDRYLRAGQFWNHVECGGHYYRAMSSWALMLSATGFKVDKIKGTVSFSPVKLGEGFTAPWFSTTGYGSFMWDKGSVEMACVSGNMEFGKLQLGRIARLKSADINGRPVGFDYAKEEGHILYTFSEEVRLAEGDVLRLA